ncbi:MAG: 4'-phosphopantetheinyl transferase superfamily protein [Clostridia bacterium]|nr:4'-phosphopantetheinyl transferase superfamily protein [Clostridia bacterium]
MNRKMDKNRTDVYLALLPCGECDEPLYPEERDTLVKNTANPTVRRERYFVWRLLEVAIRHSLGLELSEIGLCREGERWTSELADISLSHGGALAVAVSGAPVGVDIESLSGDSDTARLAERFFSDAERAEYYAAPEEERRAAFLRIWTAKEAIFKSQRSTAFAPSEVDSGASRVHSRTVRLGDEDFILSVATESELTLNIVEL